MNPEAAKSGQVTYVIRRRGGGFFSIVSSVIAHLEFANKIGAEPFVDLTNERCTYWDGSAGGPATNNAWEYFFEPVSSLGFHDAFAAGKVILSSGDHPPGATTNLSTRLDLAVMADEAIKPRPEVLSAVERAQADLGLGRKSLAVHFRGQEMRRAARHPLPPSRSQMVDAITRALDFCSFESIFVVSEGTEHLRSLKRVFGNRIVYTDSFRLYRRNSYRTNPRPSHRYLLGFEILRDAMLMALCGGLVHGDSNVSEFVRFRRRDDFLVRIGIDNGMNVGRGLMRHGLWYGRQLLPKSLGGFGHDFEVVLAQYPRRAL